MCRNRDFLMQKQKIGCEWAVAIGSWLRNRKQKVIILIDDFS